MLFEWNDQTIRWYKDASAYTGFHNALARRILPYLESGDSLLDAGCGLGRIDMEIAAHVSAITAIDYNAYVLQALLRDLESSAIENLAVRLEDVSGLKDSYDVILMSFFGNPDMPFFLEHCRRRIIRIVSAGYESSLYPKQHRRNFKETVPAVREELAAWRIGYKLELCSIEFGQPLMNRRDAELYVLKNAPEASMEEVGRFLDESIILTGRDDFPIYIPYEKKLGIFVIDKEATL